MLAAIIAVQEGISGVNQAAMDHGVPKTTLKDRLDYMFYKISHYLRTILFIRLSGRVKHGVNPGPRPYLNKTEESELSQFIKNYNSMGCGKTRKEYF